MRARRALGAALGSIIMVLAVFPVPFSTWHLFYAVSKIGTSEGERVSGCARLLESVSIAHDTPHVKSLIPFFDIRYFLACKKPFEEKANWNGRSREKRLVLVILPIWLCENVFLWERTIQNIHRITMADFKTDSLPMIFKIEADSRLVSFCVSSSKPT